MLNLKNVCKTSLNSRKQKVNLLTNIFVEIKQGDFVCVQGANGAGKSSLLSIISTEDMTFTGEYFIDGIELSKYTGKQLQELKSSKFGVVSETMDLIQRRTIEQNLEIPLHSTRLSKAEKIDLIIKALNAVGLSQKILSLKPTDLSAGQCQKVMVARAIVNSPQVVIADNPTSMMDEESTELILGLFTALNKAGVTIVVATREEGFLKRAKRVFTISRGMLVENMKVTRGKNIGEVIDIDAKKKKAKTTSIKKQVSVLEKKPQEIKPEPAAEALSGEENKPEPVVIDKTDEVKDVVKEKKKPAKTTKKKSSADENQLSIDLTSVNTKKTKTQKTTTQEKKDKKGESAKAEQKNVSTTTSLKKVSKTQEDEDSELLIKPVKSSRRKVK